MKTRCCLIVLGVLLVLLPLPGQPVLAARHDPGPAGRAAGAQRIYLPVVTKLPPHNAFGYTLEDSAGQSGLLDPVDISTTGTETAPGLWLDQFLQYGRRYGPVPLYMHFPIYDGEYNAVYIHDIGNLTFTGP
jgi:hypothetical protein